MGHSSQHPDEASDRRPIAARRIGVFQRMADALAKRRITPNAISVVGMVCGVLAGVAFAATAHVSALERLGWILGACLVGLRLLANMLDGMVAVEGGLGTAVGALFNEAPDRVSDAATLIGFGFGVGGEPWLGFLAAIAAVFVAYVRALATSAGAPNDFCGPMAKQQRMALVILAALWMAVAPADLQLESRAPTWALIVILAGCVFTSFRRLRRAATFLHERAR